MYVFVDRVDECEPGVRIVATKALALNEEFFRDHFPGWPVMPGAMILEGFIQAARHCLGELPGGHVEWTLDEVEGLRFNRFAVPGESLTLELDKDGEEDGAVRFKASARVGDAGICRAKISVRARTDANR